jgi:5-methylcytosine-specific restriction protein A
MAESQLDAIAPRRRELVYELVAAAGLNVTDWANYKKGAKSAASNPKYCYEWSFVEDERLVVLNLWHANMVEVDGVVQDTINMREYAHSIVRLRDNPLRRSEAKAVWEKRALKMDRAIQLASRKNLPVRVIVCEGDRRGAEYGDDEASHVHKRLLDPLPWRVKDYDWNTGDTTLVRETPSMGFIDQFSLASAEEAQPAATRSVHGEVPVRSADVRHRVLLRAAGNCEFCNQPGFRTRAGQIYLETHHIVPLGEGGPDVATNVVALCPNDHRRAHFALDREDIRCRLMHIAGVPRQ